MAFTPLLGPGKAEFSHQPVESKVYSNPLLATVLPKVNFRIFNIYIFFFIIYAVIDEDEDDK